MSGSNSTNVPRPVYTQAGFSTPARSDILAGVQQDLNSAFGGGLDPALDTPQGQIASTLTEIIGDNNDNLLLFTNLVDPAYTFGRMQDGIARIYFITRQPAEATTVTATCRGRTGLVIPVGSLAQSNDGHVYASTAAGTISAAGSVDIPFACVDTGPITCPVGGLATIYKTIYGWDSVYNSTAGVVGSDVETPAKFEQRRKDSVSVNARQTLASIKAQVLGLPGVLDVYATENPANTSQTIGGVTLLAHSLYVAVVGGIAADVARAIWLKKGPGCDYNGNTTITVTDTAGYSPPYPSYAVKFTVPTPTAVKVAVQIASSTTVPSDAVGQIAAVVLASFNGVDGGVRAQIGSKLFASRFYGGIARLGDWAKIVDILIGTTTANAHVVSFNIDQVPTLSVNDISVSIV